MKDNTAPKHRQFQNSSKMPLGHAQEEIKFEKKSTNHTPTEKPTMVWALSAPCLLRRAGLMDSLPATEVLVKAPEYTLPGLSWLGHIVPSTAPAGRWTPTQWAKSTQVVPLEGKEQQRHPRGNTQNTAHFCQTLALSLHSAKSRAEYYKTECIGRSNAKNTPFNN